MHPATDRAEELTTRSSFLRTGRAAVAETGNGTAADSDFAELIRILLKLVRNSLRETVSASPSLLFSRLAGEARGRGLINRAFAEAERGMRGRVEDKKEERRETERNLSRASRRK